MSNHQELYQQVILDHNKNPKNFYKMTDFDYKAKGHNPLCGDQLDLFIKVENEIIKEISFEGHGCAISKASASMMTQSLKGMKISQAMELMDLFNQMVKKEKALEEIEPLGKLKIFSGIWEYPSRVKCAILCWHTFKNAVQNGETAVTE